MVGAEIVFAGVAPEQECAVRRQVAAFFNPAREAMLADLAVAGVKIPSVFSVRFGPSNDVDIGDDEWACSLPNPERFRLGAPSSDYGMAVLERLLVQLIRGGGWETRTATETHSLACRTLERHVEPRHLPAVEETSETTAVAPSRWLRPQNRRSRPDTLVLSVAANAHDSSVAIGDENRVLLVLEAERVYRHKHKWCNGSELNVLIELALASVGREVSDVTHWVGTAMENRLLDDCSPCEWSERRRGTVAGRRVDFHVANHHLAHAAIALSEGCRDALVEASDGGGDMREYAAFRFRDGSFNPIPAAVDGFSAVFYDVVSHYAYKRFGAEGKFMGLAAHGELRADFVQWLDAHADEINRQPYEESYAMLDNEFSLSSHDPTSPVARDLARAAQYVFERRRVAQITKLSQGIGDIVLTGGAALNIHANTAIAAALPGATVHVPPCCDDSGQALGALLWSMKTQLGAVPELDLPFLGRGETDPAPISDHTARRVVDDLLDGRVIAWHWGRAEIGPRALGHRSFLAAPLSAQSRVRVSEHVKRREPYRPVAPVVLEEELREWFTPSRPSRFMLFAANATDKCKRRAPAVVHVDGSARIQTVKREEQPLGPVLDELERRCGVPILINTSLNGPSEPIVDSHQDTMQLARRHSLVVPWLEGSRCG